MRCIFQSDNFQRVSACLQWVRVPESCAPCVRECLSGVPAVCEQFFTSFTQLMYQHPSHEHSESTGYGTDPNDGIGHFDPRLPSPYA
eukprot:11110332-Alexandrium_andersonii.AAC.1